MKPSPDTDTDTITDVFQQYKLLNHSQCKTALFSQHFFIHMANSNVKYLNYFLLNDGTMDVHKWR